VKQKPNGTSGLKLHLIRHAEAVERSPGLLDEQRVLTVRGRKRFRRVAACLKGMGLDADAILTSPALRAVQTAEILAEHLRFNGDVRVCAPLASGPDPADLATILADNPSVRELVLVGHEPALGELLAVLLGLTTPCRFAKGSSVSVKITSRRGGMGAELIALVTGGGREIRTTAAALAKLQGSQQTVNKEGTP
jgi:phosphohistidine phosphatase